MRDKQIGVSARGRARLQPQMLKSDGALPTANNDASISLVANGGTTVTQTTALGLNGQLRWTEFILTGATTGDVFTVYVAGANGTFPTFS